MMKQIRVMSQTVRLFLAGLNSDTADRQGFRLLAIPRSVTQKRATSFRHSDEHSPDKNTEKIEGILFAANGYSRTISAFEAGTESRTSRRLESR